MTTSSRGFDPITNRSHRFVRPALIEVEGLGDHLSNHLGARALKWYISHADGPELVIQSTDLNYDLSRGSPCSEAHHSNKAVALSLIPTGVGCELGGYAGDAAPATRLLSCAVDYLICNTNSVNASNFINLGLNTIYTDGFALDEFCMGLTHLHLPYRNRIGVILDKASPNVIDGAMNIINTVRAVHGIEIADVVVTDRRIGGRCFQNEAGAFSGTVDNVDVLFSACEHLLRGGATAIAIASEIADLPRAAYERHFAGHSPNPVGGVEAVISYLVRERFRIPVAHAPLVNIKDLDLNEAVVDARAAGEMASWSGIACILIGLSRAPQLCGTSQISNEVISRKNVLALVMPASCLGGIPPLFLYSIGVPIIAVRQNRTVLNAFAKSLAMSRVLEVETYAEAAGLLLCLKNGISIESVHRPLSTLRPTRLGEPIVSASPPFRSSSE